MQHLLPLLLLPFLLAVPVKRRYCESSLPHLASFLSCHTNNPNIHTHYIHKPLWPYNATCPLFLLPQNTPLSSPSSSTVSTSTLLVDIIGGVIPGQFNMKIYFLMICMFYLAKTLCQMHFVTQLYSFILAWNQH